MEAFLRREGGINIEAQDELVQSIRNGNTGRITALEAENPGIINAKDKDQTPFFFEAIIRDQKGSLDCMIELKIDLDAKDKHGRSAQDIAKLYKRKEISQMLEKAKLAPGLDKTQQLLFYQATKSRN